MGLALKKKKGDYKASPKTQRTGTEIQHISPVAVILTTIFALNFVEGFGCRNREKSSQTGPVSEILPAILSCCQGMGPFLNLGHSCLGRNSPGTVCILHALIFGHEQRSNYRQTNRN